MLVRSIGRSRIHRVFVALTALGLTVSLGGTLRAGGDGFKTALARAEDHERSYEWAKAFAAYEDALKLHRDVGVRDIGVKERQTTVLRRYWQEQRHQDLSYRKEVLSLDYAQALRLNASVFDALIDSSLPQAKLTSGILLRKGLEELETALQDPVFATAYLAPAKSSYVPAFREYLVRRKGEAGRMGRGDCMKTMRDVALAGQSVLDLNPTVALMELACGACYGIDDYTAYLTPMQFRDLSDSLKPGPMTFTPSVQAALKSAAIGYLRISHLQETTPQEVEDAFAVLTKEGVKGLVLDLRGNPGGLVEPAIEVTRRFLVSGVIASTRNSDPKLSIVYHSRNADAWTIPLVVLIDGETASAAELIAGALKDNNRARLLGQPTYGKGSLQGLVKLPDALGNLPTGGLRLTIARFFSPKGMPYSGQGVLPDLYLAPIMSMEMDMDAADPHVVAAIDELHREISR